MTTADETSAAESTRALADEDEQSSRERPGDQPLKASTKPQTNTVDRTPLTRR
ncbi:MAG: hypothetical protein ABJB03_00510 [Rhodoglobus sp.]